jgi:hypothetical protein
MTTSPAPRTAPAAVAVSGDTFVLPERYTRPGTGPGPRFDDDVWDLRPFVARTATAVRIDFTKLPDAIAIHTMKEYLYSRIRRGSSVGAASAKPTKLTNLAGAAKNAKTVMQTLREVGAARLADTTQANLDAALRKWKTVSDTHAAAHVTAAQHLAAHGPFLTLDRLPLQPWLGRSGRAVARLRPNTENSTARIPEHISGPLIKAAVFYVQTASRDILTARQALASLQATPPGPKLRHGQGEAKIQTFLDQLRAQGRRLPALPVHKAHTRPGVRIVNGIAQSPNSALIGLLAGVRRGTHYTDLLIAAGEELGYEPGTLGTAISAWPNTGRPWRDGLDPHNIRLEVAHLRTACWIVIAFLSGMRDAEVRELRRDSAFTETGQDGRIRYKLRGHVFKGSQRALHGDEAEWVVLELVHQAVHVLLKINDGSDHLFGRHAGGQNLLLSDLIARIGKFRDHLNDIFATTDGPFIPHDTVSGDDGAGARAVPWLFNTRQFRRTLAWHIAHQPFGIVAGAKQYQHTKITIFEGYAGTSASGFASEVASEEAVAKLDYLEDLYRDWNDGGRSTGGATQKIDAEFDRVRRELGDMPGVVASPARLRTLLQHLTRILHPGALNDCFHQPATAVCAKRAKTLGRPLPLHNSCSVCPNSRRTAVHIPRLITARDQARQALAAHRNASLPPLQQIALSQYAASFDQLITELQHAKAPQP